MEFFSIFSMSYPLDPPRDRFIGDPWYRTLYNRMLKTGFMALI